VPAKPSRPAGASVTYVLAGVMVGTVPAVELELSRFLRQTVKSQNSMNGELTHGIVSKEVY